jgi:ABC-2 type transport system ATP-binding protein
LSVIEVESLAKRYGDVLAVDSVSLTITQGEVFSLVGRNGAGKSTLIRMIIGITEPDAGRVLVCGEDVSHRAPSTKKHIGYLPEELLLYERLTGREYLRLVAGLKEADPARIEDELEFFEIAHAAGKLVGGYSLGMRKKLGLAAAWIGGPDALILDEPLNGLDVEMMRKLRLRIEAEQETGRTFLISSHVMSFVERVSSRVAIIRAGKIVADGSPAELRSLSALGDAQFEDVFFHLAG